MTEQERLDREMLLKRAAAAAGAVYFAPVMTSAASAEVQECPTFLCKNTKKWKKCREVGQGHGRTCNCNTGESCHPAWMCPAAACVRSSPTCDVQPCPGCNGRGACMQDATRPNDGLCVDFAGRSCSELSPCDALGNCPPGECCFLSCCPTPLCAAAC